MCLVTGLILGGSLPGHFFKSCDQQTGQGLSVIRSVYWITQKGTLKVSVRPTHLPDLPGTALGAAPYRKGQVLHSTFAAAGRQLFASPNTYQGGALFDSCD